MDEKSELGQNIAKICQTFTFKKTSIKRTPPLSARGHLCAIPIDFVLFIKSIERL